MKNLFRRAFGGGGGNRSEARDIVREAAKQLGSEAAKVGRHCYADSETKVVSEIKDDRTIRRKDDKSETEAISRHSEAHSQSAEWLQKTRLSAGLFCNYVGTFNANENFQAKESSLLQYKAVAKNENNSTETDHASMPLRLFASKSTSKSVSCRHSVLKLLLARNCHSYCCRRYELRSSLPELATRPQFRNADLHKKAAFTLAEVLITLGIIGVVAAITMPVLLSNVNNKVKAERVLNIKQKLSKVTDKMAVQSGLMGYENTEDFVKEMQKHMKIAKVCDNAHLDNCWPTKEVTLDDEGKTWEISKTKNAKTLKVAKADGDDWSDTVGIVTADGTAMILSYNKGCTFDVDKTGLQGNGAASNSLNCLAGVFDWNGGKKPNKLAKLEGDSNGDVITLGKAGGLGSACSLEIGGKCFSAPFIATSITKAECEAEKGKLGIKGCYYEKDYWAGAVKQCGGVSKMPTMADLGKLATELYGTTVGAKQDVDAKLDTSKAASLGFGNSDFAVWSGEENDSYSAYSRGFLQSYTGWGNLRSYSGFQAVCVSE